MKRLMILVIVAILIAGCINMTDKPAGSAVSPEQQKIYDDLKNASVPVTPPPQIDRSKDDKPPR